MAPNMRSADRLEQTSEKLQAVDREFNDSRKSYRKAQQEFQKVQQRRMELFNKAFNHIKDQIAPVYKDLTKSSSWPLGGQAYLDVEEEDEPYLSGVKYHATPPGKRFRDMEHLSGGEKTMAALALLFAIHTYAPSPFFVLDEVDAALDVANTMRLANYVREKAGPGMQFVVISLKAGLFQESETLVGVMRDQGVNSSRALTLDVSYSDCGFRWFDGTCLLTMCAVAKISGCLGLSGHDNKIPMALRASARETYIITVALRRLLSKMAVHANSGVGSRLVASLVYDIHNTFHVLRPYQLFHLLTILFGCSLSALVTSTKHQKTVITRVCMAAEDREAEPRLTTAKASPRRQLVRADTLCSTETFEKQRGSCSAVQVFVIVVACAGIYVAGLRRPFMRSAYPQHPPSAACYITTKELYVPHHTNATRVKTHNSATRISQPFAWRAKRESMAQAWRCHPATPPSFKTP
jgi:energy-coupling factor transporter ATP-binding protein EcfA2